MKYSEIKERVSMVALLGKYDIQLDSSNRCKCPLHGGNSPSFSVHSSDQAWTCHSKCPEGANSGDIFSFVEYKDGVSNKEARTIIMSMFGLSEEPKGNTKPQPSKLQKGGIVTETVEHQYHDKDGKEIYFITRTKYDNGRKKFIPTRNGIHTLPVEHRILYNYHKVYGTDDYVYLCEGEKCADALIECGFVATTNVGGSGGWNKDTKDQYSDMLKGLKVVIMPDADEPSEKWKNYVTKSLAGKVAQLQVVNMPDAFVQKYKRYKGHDFADMLEVAKNAGDIDRAVNWLTDQTMQVEVLPYGVSTSFFNEPSAMFDELRRKANLGESTTVFNLSRWLPSLKMDVLKGDLIVLMANTSVGKSRILQNFPYSFPKINFCLFDLELSEDVLAERYAAFENDISHTELRRRLKAKERIVTPSVTNVFLPKIKGLDVDKIKTHVETLEQIRGINIDTVGIDYIGVMSGGSSSYEGITEHAEQFKEYLAGYDKIGILTTQVARPSDKEDGHMRCPSPFSAKGSGAIENSAQELIAFWKAEGDDKHQLNARVIKYTHGEKPLYDIKLRVDDLRVREDMGYCDELV